MAAIIIADEPVSALDVSVQAHVLNLMMDLRDRLRLSMLFISHDLGVIGQISCRVAVMYMGRVVEQSGTRTVLDHPLHPYTRAGGSNSEAGSVEADPGAQSKRVNRQACSRGRTAALTRLVVH
ncbi:ABC transporter ATP-binding protein [Bradyrhizobium sp. WSM471]|uniref:ABC transporter ATP-binding protein n=1 Tax=Bradyrhizobium sp. WSM471 TaxID=319017 RepID=UPI0003144656|nr:MULTISPECIES: ABC transporter ATP-binding protein [Bradyrhizobium]